MDLCSVSIKGFRRFRQNTNLKTNGKLVALVGPNEAGKSSLLDALVSLGNDIPIADTNVARGLKSADVLITGRFFLTKADLTASALDQPSWLDVIKSADGTRQYVIRPKSPERDLAKRGRMLASINLSLERKHIREALEAVDPEIDEVIKDTVAVLQSDKESFTEEEVARVRHLALQIPKLAKARDLVAIRKLNDQLDEWADSELAVHPRTHAIEALKKRVPSIIVFGDDDRNLQSEYDLEEISATVPDALENLALVAELDIAALIRAHKKGNAGDVSTIEYAANKVLESKFQESWKQSGVHVSLRTQGEALAIQVVNEKHEFTSFAERSDGLRQFVALQAFATTGWSGDTILIIDEAEQRLHYDAQADLVQMLARQDVASKIIYTTHSAGCLPEDLGNGVHFVHPMDEDRSASEIINKFWADDDPGFSALLFGMGASTLAFFPTRNAVLVEGPSDILLLPTMLREALSTDVLGFQIVPGLAEEARSNFAPMFKKKTRLCYVVDGDIAGQGISKQLMEEGVAKEAIFQLKTTDKSAVELEDFLDPALLLEGVNSLLAKFHGAVEPLKKSDLPSRERMKAVCGKFKESTKVRLPKVELAYEILDLLTADPLRECLDSKRSPAFKQIAEGLTSQIAKAGAPTRPA